MKRYIIKAIQNVLQKHSINYYFKFNKFICVTKKERKELQDKIKELTEAGFNLNYAWFSTYDLCNSTQGGFSVICTDEEDGWGKVSINTDVADCGFNELDEAELLDLIIEYKAGIIDRSFFTRKAFTELRKNGLV